MAGKEFVFPPKEPLEGFPYDTHEPYFATNDEVTELSWNVCEQFVDLCRERMWQPEQVVMMTRGGTEQGKALSKMLEIQDMSVFAARSYKPTGDGSTEIKLPDIEVIRWPQLINPSGRGSVFAEDMADTGETIRFGRRLWKEAMFVAGYSKLPEEQTREVLDVWGKILTPEDPEKSVWIIYEDDLRKQQIYPLISAATILKHADVRVTRVTPS